MTDVVVIVPMLGRAEQVPRLAESLARSTDRARLLFVATEGDDDVIEAVAAFDHLIHPPRVRGDYAEKINDGVNRSDEPLIFTAAIDLHFHPGWLEACERHLSDDVQVVGTNDLTNPRTSFGHSTHTLVTRAYAERGLIDGRPGLLCPDYLHEFVDDEMIGTAIKRGVYAHAFDAWVEHLHPMGGKAEWDPIYLQMRRRMATDKRLYHQRSQQWT